ncbi:NlpC/P60 family protein [Hydromonas duriensis]|uniref:NlpC/P60 family protein n=2 Tax=Hydromonas duriensis TaxID=1527608 RepID=A0A4R6Y8D8_9BURK|nr:NlpC/P60 family protein [Hydromonas duriensis]
MQSYISKFFLLLLTMALVACGSTSGGRKGGHGGYTKPPLVVKVGAGPNRALAVQAMKYLGTPYHFGGSSPAEGFDCSGLVQWSGKQSLGINLPRTTTQQSVFGEELRYEQLQAGDLVFFNTSGQPNSHVGIYLGNTFFVHAPSSGGVVRVESLNNPYWQPRINLARRIR